MIYQRISLPTGTPVGEPGPLPAALLGLENLTLADLPAALDPCPEEWADTGFWPLIDETPEFDPATHRLDGTWTDTMDTEARTVTRVAGIEPLPPPSVDDLLAHAAQRRWEVETGGITVAGAPIRTDEKSQNKITGAVILLDKDQALDEVDWEAQPEVWVTADRATMEAVGLAVGRHVQACFSALRQIQAAIRATPPTITTLAEIDAAFAAAVAPPPPA